MKLVITLELEEGIASDLAKWLKTKASLHPKMNDTPLDSVLADMAKQVKEHVTAEEQ